MDKTVKTFAHHTPSESSVTRIQNLRKAFAELGQLILNTCPGSREQVLAITNLEESAMWAIKGVVIYDTESKVEEFK